MFSVLPTKFLQPVNLAISTALSLFSFLTTCQPSYLHSLISLQLPHSTCSSSVVTVSRSPIISSLKITDRLFRYASPRLWNQLPYLFPNFVSLISPVWIHLIHLSTRLCLYHHSHHPPVLYFFTPGSKLTFSTNPFHFNCTSLPIGLPLWSWDWTGLIMLISLFLVYSFTYFIHSMW